MKILDFGISKFTKDEEAKLTSAGAIMGTALYMSPEQIRGAASIDARSDIWALGVILYELIGGQPPWTGPTTRVAACVVTEPAPDIRALCPIPEPLAEAIHRMLEKDASRRPASVGDVASEIAPYAPPGTIGADVADHLARRQRPEPRPELLAGGLLAVAPGRTDLAPGRGRDAAGRPGEHGARQPAASRGRQPRALHDGRDDHQRRRGDRAPARLGGARGVRRVRRRRGDPHPPRRAREGASQRRLERRSGGAGFGTTCRERERAAGRRPAREREPAARGSASGGRRGALRPGVERVGEAGGHALRRAAHEAAAGGTTDGHGASAREARRDAAQDNPLFLE